MQLAALQLEGGGTFNRSGLIDCELIIPAYLYFTILFEYGDNWGSTGRVFNR